LKTHTTIEDGSRLSRGDLAIVIPNDYMDWNSTTDRNRRGYFLRKSVSFDTIKTPIAVNDVCLVLEKNNEWVTIMIADGRIGNIQFYRLGFLQNHEKVERR
jgi:hypothetical protein